MTFDSQDSCRGQRRFWLVAGCALTLLLGTACGERRDRIPVIVDHDGATDDYLALLMLLGSGCCDLRGVTVSYGLGHRDPAVRATGMILRALELDVPVAGHAAALRGPNSFPESWRDTSEHVVALPMLRDLEGPAAKSTSTELLIELLAGSSSPVTVIATGPLTNISDAFAKRPDLLGKVGQLVVMGGALDVPGNVRDPDGSGVAEYNFFVDPVSADRVLALAAEGLDITLAPLDVTNELPLSAAWLEQLKSRRSFGAQLAAGVLAAVEPQIAAGKYYLWDGAAVLALLSPRSMSFERVALTVQRDGPEQGRLRRASARTATVQVAAGAIEPTQALKTAIQWLSGARPES